MTAQSYARTTLLAGALALTLAAPVFAAEPTTHDVYVAAEAGNYTQAQSLMDEVLKAHPNSATAHFVEAELQAKQGQFAAAQGELATAERLSPGLPKVSPAAVAKLRTLLSEGQKPRASYAQQPVRSNNGYGNSGYNQSSGMPWGTILFFGVILVGFIVVASRFMARRQAQQGDTYTPAGYNPGAAPAPGYAPGGGYPPPGYGPGYGQPQQGSGMGSRIMGGLATGAAVGAGIVAGEALARQFTGGNHDSGNHDQSRNDVVYDDPSARQDLLRRDDMGGNDFGVNDTSSWGDDTGGGGGGGGGDWD